jgi:hypothetical protein
MKIDSIRLAAVEYRDGESLTPALHASDLIGDPADGSASGLIGDPTDTVVDPPDFAAHAARAALARAQLEPNRVGQLYHVVEHPFAEDGIDPAMDLVAAAELPANRHPAFTVAGGRQSVLDTLTVASLFLARFDTMSVLITAGDVGPARSLSPSGPRHDAGAAIVLSTGRGNLALTATATAYDSHLLQAPRTGDEHAIRRHADGLTEQVVDAALRDARVERRQVDAVVTAYDPDTPQHCSLVELLDLCPGTYVRATPPRMFTRRGSAVNLIRHLATLSYQPDLPTGARILVVAEGKAGTVTAAVLRAVEPDSQPAGNRR